MSLDPIRTTESIRTAYVRYLKTLFPLSDADLQREFQQSLEQEGRLIKGPFIEAMPPYATGKTLQQLVDEAVLCPQWSSLDSPELPLGRPLYLHQEIAIRKAVAGRRNLVIATGTGSGKTECFLVPILDALLREGPRLEEPGVRALLLYPMNALANDQLRRLRRLLRHCEAITFGRYTGETPDTDREADERFRKMFPNEPRLENELLSREAMHARPPHILLTNYAMLEYLLLRPQDSPLFEGDAWRFVVLDEVHTYDGAKGIEVAMLLRRLRERVVSGAPGRLQCFATSATLGGGAEDYEAIARFASELFGEPFEWDSNNPDRQDVVGPSIETRKGQCWGKPALTFYSIALTALQEGKSAEDLASIAVQSGIPEAVVEAAMGAPHGGEPTAETLVAHLLEGDARVHEVSERLASGPLPLQELREVTEGQLEPLVALIELANQSRPGSGSAPVMPARYHLFVSATDGAFIVFAPKRRVMLDRHEEIQTAEGPVKVFELAACRRCGAPYLVGRMEMQLGRRVLVQDPGARLEEEGGDEAQYFLLAELVVASESERPNEDDELEDQRACRRERYLLCARCGAIDRTGELQSSCVCPPDRAIRLQLVAREPQQDASYCLSCRARGSDIISRLMVGNEAAASVLVTSVYQNLPKRPLHQRSHGAGLDSRRTMFEGAEHDEMTKRLLLFADSRQDAAFFASYLQRTYDRILRRRLIVEVLRRNAQDIAREGWRLQDLVGPLMTEAESRRLFSMRQSPVERRAEIWRWLLLEVVPLDRPISLEGVGCIGFRLEKPPGWKAPLALRELPLNLDDDEAWELYAALLDTLRLQGIVALPDNLPSNIELPPPLSRPRYIRQHVANAQRLIFSWVPANGHSNRRLDYIQRLARMSGADSTDLDEWSRQLLSDIWTSFRLEQPGYPFSEYLLQRRLQGEGVVYQLSSQLWRLVVPTDEASSAMPHRCDTCGHLTQYNVRGVCPTFRCSGRLRRVEQVDPDHHYRRLYLTLDPFPLRVEEHTAQLTPEEAASVQQSFLEGVVNALSCSTTFELGVDLGELETVILRNVPPTAANYAQRAGRAGRRTGSTAFVVTFAQRRPHDRIHFLNPIEMVSGKIHPPRIRIRNAKIVLRHIFAVAFAQFWREYPQTFGTVSSFFLPEGNAGPEHLRAFLDARPAELLHSLLKVVPEPMHEELGIRDWRWVTYLFDDPGPLTRATEEIRNDLKQLEEARQALFRAQRESDRLLRLQKTLERRPVLDYLSSRNVLPKYGFPVDVVELDVRNSQPEAPVVLARDLRIALSEYAPGSQVVARGKLWTSYGLKRVPKLEWPRYHFVICRNCRHYHRVWAETAVELPTECPACHQPLVGGLRGTFVEPIFGFVTNAESPGNPGDKRPPRVHITGIYFSGKAEAQSPWVSEAFGPYRVGLRVARDGRLAVITQCKFGICNTCGYGERRERTEGRRHRQRREHKTPYRHPCNGDLTESYLGHEFLTDVAQLHFDIPVPPVEGFYESLLYAILEGVARALNISRDDLDGCLYTAPGQPGRRDLILFDSVPGGAGHVQRLLDEPGALRRAVAAAAQRVDGGCGCGEETSCYGCLRRYDNQALHSKLRRGPVKRFLQQLLEHVS